uniref:Subunit 4 of NADH-plastoquinone oxidoreductase n=1 Tax=Klebsormidium sp. SAG 51.86 TaxID=1856625 RepID=A0A191T6J0_9VIRI|nr:subunit 4 of NADH-plastoquinone oxidoreductase [Klebsormidium sp. SAG 51.86]
MNTFPWLSTVVALPLLSSFPLPWLRERGNHLVRWYCLVVCLIDFLLLGYVLGSHYDFSVQGLQLREDWSWIPALGVHWSLGLDGLSMCLALLTGFVTTLAVLGAWPVTRHPCLFYVLMLAMYTGQMGLFASQDMLLFFLMWELELVPVYFLLSLWGGRKRLYAATKFLLTTGIASLFILLSAIVMALYGKPTTWDLSILSIKSFPLALQITLYLGLFVAFGVKIASFPLHSWLPDTHGEAHPSTCMLLAGILLKMGGYGLIRLNVQIFSQAHHLLAPWLIALGVINIVYAALTSLAQRNLKRKIAYSSISHMGFVLIGIGSLTDIGMSGALLQMISHGLIGASLFFLAGALYDRTRTLILEHIGDMARPMPKMFALFTASSLSSLALPGMSGFPAELLVFFGLALSQAYPLSFRIPAVALQGLGIVLTPIYLLAMLRQIFYGKQTRLNNRHFVDLGPRETFVSFALLLPIVGIGICPQLVTQLYQGSLSW